MKTRKTLLILLLSFLLAGYFFGQRSGSTNKSNEEINRLLKELKKTGEDPARVNILTELGNEYLYIDPGKALNYGKQGVKLSKKINYQKGLADCFNLIGNFYLDQNNYTQALAYQSKSLQIREKIEDKKGICDSYGNIGLVYKSQGNYNQALEYYLKSLRIAEKTGEKKGKYAAYHNIGAIYYAQGNYSKALAYFFKCLKIMEQVGDKRGTASSYNNIGMIHRRQGDYNQALKYYLKSMQIWEMIGDKQGLSGSYNNIAVIYSIQDNYSQALPYFFKSLNIKEEMGDKNGISNTYHNIGIIYSNQGNYSQALAYFFKSLRIREELGNKQMISISYNSIGITYKELGQLKKSLDYLHKSLKLAEEMNAKYEMKEICGSLSWTYEALKDHKKALEYHKRSTELKEDIFNTEKTKEITRIRTRYEVEKKEAENESLKQKNKIQELSLGKRKNLITAFIFISGLMLILVFVTYNGYRLKKKSNKIIQAEKEKVVQANQAKGELLVKLEEKSEKLKEMDKIKSRFFANISHEFRTPLTLIIGPLEQMLSASRDKNREETIRMALRHSKRLLDLINQLLDLSKLDSDKMQLHASKQNIIPFLKGVVGSFQSLAEQKKVDLSFHTTEEDITLYYDAEKLEKVMVNIIANAVKFTPAGGKITLSAVVQNTKQDNDTTGHLEIKVCDTGIGIPEKQLPYIFDRFYQANGSLSGEHHHKGTGIGLALVKELVTLHHGDIHVTSRESKGTEFTIRLPLEPGVPAEHKDVPADNKEHLKPEEGAALAAMEEFETQTSAQNKEEDHIDTGANGKDVILVVEDNPDMRKYIRGPLEAEYTVIEAADGEEGIEKAREIIPDLIISDVMMPRKDGFQLCDGLKKDVKTSHIPIILLTAKASEASIIEGLETGADDYITKPFNIKILLARIKNLIDLRLQLQETIQREMMLQPTEIAVSSIDREFMKEIKEAIEKNLSDMEFGVDELVKSLYMSRTTLNRKIRALTGESTNRFIRSYRLKRAAQLLKDNFGNVTEVAFEVGFSSSNYFTRCFKEKFHQLPHAYAGE